MRSDSLKMRQKFGQYMNQNEATKKKNGVHVALGQHQNEKDCSKISLHFDLSYPVPQKHIGLTCYCPLCFARFQPGPRSYG